MTIAEAAEDALRKIGRPGSIKEIYEKIITLELYEFNTEMPEHVLRTEIRRKTEGVERVDSSQETRFRLAGDEVYGLRDDPTVRRGNSGTKRIHRATDKEDVIKALMSEKNGPFREIWRVLLFAAVVGYHQGRREPLSSIDSGKGIDQGSFANNPAWPGILYLLSLVEDDSTENLKDDESAEARRISMFEEYANGGLALLMEAGLPGELSVEKLLTYIQEHASPRVVSPPTLEISL